MVEKCDAKSIGALLRHRPNTAPQENQCVATVGRGNLCHIFYCFNVEVSAPVINPSDVGSTVQITDTTRLTRATTASRAPR